MSCSIEFDDSFYRCDFNCTGSKQQILVDMLLKYGDQNDEYVAEWLGITLDELGKIREGKYALVGEQASELAHLFLMFFGQLFFKKFTVIRRYN